MLVKGDTVIIYHMCLWDSWLSAILLFPTSHILLRSMLALTARYSVGGGCSGNNGDGDEDGVMKGSHAKYWCYMLVIDWLNEFVKTVISNYYCVHLYKLLNVLQIIKRVLLLTYKFIEDAFVWCGICVQYFDISTAHAMSLRCSVTCLLATLKTICHIQIECQHQSNGIL